MLDASILQDVKTLIGDGLSCPADIEGLNQIIDLKNKLTKQLNKIYNKIDSITSFLNPLDNLIGATEDGIKAAQIGIDALQFIPSTVATPIPVAPVLQGQKAIDALNKLIGKTKGQISTGLNYIEILKSKLEMVLDLLQLVDLFIGTCAKEIQEKNALNDALNRSDDNRTNINDQGGSGLKEQLSISKQLLESTNAQAKQGSPVVEGLNGFTFKVVNIDGETVGDLKRRQAQAINQYNIVMLQGDPSFSSNDQILIDELIYYIKQNNLKA